MTFGWLGNGAENAVFFRDYLDGQIILPQGFEHQAMGWIAKGEVEVYSKTTDGEDAVLQVLGENETFGLHSLFDNIARPSGIRARGKTRVALMDKREYLRFAHANPQLAFTILKSISLRLRHLAGELKQKKLLES